MERKFYTPEATEDFIVRMVEKGWDALMLNEGSLGIGDWVLLSPDNKHWNFTIREVHLNSYSSAQTIRRCKKISATLQKQIDKIIQ